MVRYLDCSNYKGAIDSVQNILGIPKEHFVGLFRELDTDSMYEECPGYDSFEETIFPYLRNRFEIKTNFDYTCWFHGTRIFPNQVYTKGILPLTSNLDFIWSNLKNLAPKYFSSQEWNEFRQKMTEGQFPIHFTELYSMKVADNFHYGPYGLLVRELFEQPKRMGNWDYLGAPEIVYDICATFKDNYDYDLLSSYLNYSQACIVKFKDKNNRKYLLGVSLAYIYCKTNDIKIWQDCSYAYNGHAIGVPAEDIITVEIIEGWQSQNGVF